MEKQISFLLKTNTLKLTSNRISLYCFYQKWHIWVENAKQTLTMMAMFFFICCWNCFEPSMIMPVNEIQSNTNKCQPHFAWKRWFISLVRNDRLQCLKKIYPYICVHLEKKKIVCWLPTVILKTQWHNKTTQNTQKMRHFVMFKGLSSLYLAFV